MYKETADDLTKKFHGTYAQYKGDVVFVSHFAEAGKVPGETIQCNMAYKNGEKNSPVVLEPGQLEPIVFNATMLNNTEFRNNVESPAVPCVLVQRKPKRQWKRGICNENTSVKCPIYALYTSLGRSCSAVANQLDILLIKRLIKPEYPAFNMALELCKRYQAVAVSPMFAVTLSTISSERYLFASPFGFIGEAVPGRIIVKHPPALQEVRDWVARSGQHSIGVELAG